MMFWIYLFLAFFVLMSMFIALIGEAYETAVEDRNYTGIQLIDRNDELCILYEKHNIQEQVLTKGELELQAREEDIRRLNLERVELGREKEVVRKARREEKEKAERIRKGMEAMNMSAPDDQT